MPATALIFGGCEKASPVPQQALDQLKTYIESNGQQAPRQDIFSMPAGVRTEQTPGPVIKVTNVRYDRSVPFVAGTNDIPSGTVMHTYEIWDKRIAPDGSQDAEQNWFQVYLDPSGQWRFVKCDNPYQSSK